MPSDAFARWLDALDARYLAELTPAEVARALRALSSCYVERRDKLSRGGALESAGKRAAFALFYAPLHFLVTREIVRGLSAASPAQVIDLGCGTGAAGAAWALEAGTHRITGYDRHPWAVTEATWTYRQFGLRGRALRSDLSRVHLGGAARSGILAAYTVNELQEETRRVLLAELLEARRRDASVLIVEPIARSITSWWTEWKAAFAAAGGRSDEWRVPARLPARQQQLARAAGLDPRELTARTLWLG